MTEGQGWGQGKKGAMQLQARPCALGLWGGEGREGSTGDQGGKNSLVWVLRCLLGSLSGWGNSSGQLEVEA